MFNTSHHVIHILTGLIVKNRPLRFLPLLLILFFTTFCTMVGAVDIITTMAGNGKVSSSGEGLATTSTEQSLFSQRVALDSQGNLYIADGFHTRILKVDTTGIITTVTPEPWPRMVAIDCHGNLFIADAFGISKMDTVNFTITRANGYEFTTDSNGNSYITDPDNQPLCKADTSNIIATMTSNGTSSYSGDGGVATNAQLNYPSGVAIDSHGNLYIADSANHRVRKVDTAGIMTTVAGNGTERYSDGGEAATNTPLNYPNGVAIDHSGNLYIIDSYNITDNITDNLYVVLSSRVRKVDTLGIISTLGDWGWGWGWSWEEFQSYGIAIDSGGSLYITDSVGQNIDKVETTGRLNTVVGESYNRSPRYPGFGEEGYRGDSGVATSAQLNDPNGVAIDNFGNLYIADTYNHRIRKVDTAGIITTVAGNGTMGYSGDGAAATHARLNRPTSVAIDNIGNLYIADTENHRIRKVYPSGIITTVAGNGTAGYSGDGGEATNAQLNNPTGVTLDSYGNLYIADRNNHRIRKVSPVPLPPVEPTPLETGQVNNTFNAAGQTFSTEVTIQEGGQVFYATFENTVFNQGIISNSTLRGETDNHGSISNVTCEGEVKNHGFMSNLTLTPSATLTGGILSGTITNQGTIADIQFLGIVLEGGTLAGTLTNASRVGGTINNVHLAAHAKLSGGNLTGNIQGDCQAPAQLDHLTVKAGSHLSCITIGPQVTLEKGVIVESPPPTDLPSLGNGIATNDQGETITSTATFTGGVSINDSQTFEPTAIAKGFIDNLNIQGNITIDPQEITPTADIVVFLTYQATATDQPVFLMMDGKGGYWPWNQQPASLVPFRQDVTLTSEQPIVLYQGVWLMTGILKITFGYRLGDGTLIQSPKAIEIELTQ